MPRIYLNSSENEPSATASNAVSDVATRRPPNTFSPHPLSSSSPPYRFYIMVRKDPIFEARTNVKVSRLDIPRTACPAISSLSSSSPLR